MSQPRTSTVSGGICVLRQLRLFSSSDAPSALALDLSISETLTAVSICLSEFDIGSTDVAVVPCVDQPKRQLGSPSQRQKERLSMGTSLDEPGRRRVRH